MESQTIPGAFFAWNEYSPAGNITRSTFQQPFMGGSTTPIYRYDYNYDSHYRLTSANYAHGYYFPLSTTSAYRVDNLSYDAAGNILSLRRRNQNGNIVDNLSYSYQSSTNRLQLVMDAAGKTHGWQAGTTYYNYDASGNLTFAEEFDYQGTIWEYTRDTRNQVIRAAGWGSEAITDYRYNFAGHRYYKHVSGGSWEYFGLDDGVRTGLFGQATPGPIWNILTPSGRVIGRNPYNGGPSYYVTDHLGSTRVVVSSNGSIQETYDYYPFGLPMPGRSITGWSETPERFTGYYKDQESYLYHAQARMYDPAIGRFMSVDPLAYMFPSWSPYNYTFNNPIRFIDPDGRSSECHDLMEENCKGSVYLPSGSGIPSWMFGASQQSGSDSKDQKQGQTQQENNSKSPAERCLGLNCPEAVAAFSGTIELSLTQGNTTHAQRLASTARFGRLGSTFAGYPVGAYSLYLDFNNPNVNNARLGYRAVGVVASWSTPIIMSMALGSSVGPYGVIAGFGVGVIFVAGEFAYDNMHVPVQAYDTQKKNLIRSMNQFERAIKEGRHPFRR